jgi:DNA-binding transcriptional LysR family regulator
MKINLDALRAIDAIETYGSFTKAAEKLHKAQTTITYVIKKVENNLNIKIFERHGNRVALTASGKILLHEGRKILYGLRKLEQRVKKIEQGEETEFRIILDEMLPFSKLLPCITAFKNTHPTTLLKFSSTTLGGSLDALVDDRADMAIAPTDDLANTHGISSMPLCQLAMIFVIAPAHLLAGKSETPDRDMLLQHNLVALADHPNKLPAPLTWLAEEQDIIYLPNLSTKLEALLSGLGGGFLPEYLARPYIESGALVEKKIPHLSPQRQYSLLWRTGDHSQALDWWRHHISCMKFD